MTEPTQTCVLCGRVVVVRDSTRGFPPETAKRKLRRLCRAAGCPCDPIYVVGVQWRVASPPVPDEPYG